MADYSAKLEALRQISTALTKKEEVSAELWTTAGMKSGSRLKDVSAEITSLKKKVSAQQKAQDEGSDEEEEEDKSKKSGHRKDQREKKDQRRLGADQKSRAQAMARGDYNMKTDHVFIGEDGEVHEVQ